jgi:hypothetical protein
MFRNETLRLLLGGEYVCEIAHPLAYEYLVSERQVHFVNEWLGAIEMRLARVGEAGAFFMAPKVLSSDDTQRIRDEFLRFRDGYGPAIRMLQVIRAAKDELELIPGVYIQHAELVQKVNDSPATGEQLRNLVGTIRQTETRYNNAELMKKLLEHLRGDGYLVLTDESTEMYRTTGKLEQLTHVLRFLGENADFSRSPQDDADATDVVDDLFDQTPSA